MQMRDAYNSWLGLFVWCFSVNRQKQRNRLEAFRLLFRPSFLGPVGEQTKKNKRAFLTIPYALVGRYLEVVTAD